MTADIYQQWLNAKKLEQESAKLRRELEDDLIRLMEVPEDLEGTVSAERDGYKIKVVGRMNRKVDSDKVQELAAEHGLTDSLSSFFRWKPEINMTAWKMADKTITQPLLGGIETKPGRPSFTITKEN